MNSGGSRAERANELRLQLGVRAMVAAADDVRDLEVDVVDRARELVRRRAVGAQQRRPPEAQRALGVGLADLVRRLAMAHEAARSGARGPSSQRDAEPLEVGGDRLGAAFDVARRVGVVDPQEQRAAVLVGEAAVRDRAERVAEMERAGRARSEADADHGASLVWDNRADERRDRARADDVARSRRRRPRAGGAGRRRRLGAGPHPRHRPRRPPHRRSAVVRARDQEHASRSTSSSTRASTSACRCRCCSRRFPTRSTCRTSAC